jgi:hypothetical protein
VVKPSLLILNKVRFYKLLEYNFFLLSFSLDEKETKNQGKKMLPRTRLGLPAFLPTQRT